MGIFGVSVLMMIRIGFAVSVEVGVFLSAWKSEIRRAEQASEEYVHMQESLPHFMAEPALCKNRLSFQIKDVYAAFLEPVFQSFPSVFISIILFAV